MYASAAYFSLKVTVYRIFTGHNYHNSPCHVLVLKYAYMVPYIGIICFAFDRKQLASNSNNLQLTQTEGQVKRSATLTTSIHPSCVCSSNQNSNSASPPLTFSISPLFLLRGAAPRLILTVTALSSPCRRSAMRLGCSGLKEISSSGRGKRLARPFSVEISEESSTEGQPEEPCRARGRGGKPVGGSAVPWTF